MATKMLAAAPGIGGKVLGNQCEPERDRVIRLDGGAVVAVPHGEGASERPAAWEGARERAGSAGLALGAQVALGARIALRAQSAWRPGLRRLSGREVRPHQVLHVAAVDGVVLEIAAREARVRDLLSGHLDSVA